MAGLAVGKDGFTVDSYHNGELHSYVVSKQDGFPSTMHIGSTTTEEENGLKLEVAVDINDIPAYTESAENIYKYFDHKPNLNKDIDVELDVKNKLSDDWLILGKTNSTNNFVVMSQVAYLIPYNRALEDHGFSKMVIKVPPGSVTFNPGRESLSMDKKTIAYLNKTFSDIKHKYLDVAAELYEETENDKELVELHGKLYSVAPYSLRKELPPLDYASKWLLDILGTGRFVGTSAAKSFDYVEMGSAFYTNTSNMLNVHVKPTYYKTSKKLCKTNAISVNSFFSAKHVVVDMKTRFKSTLNNMFVNKNLILWQRNGKEDIEDAVDKAKEYLTALGLSYSLASDLIPTDTDITSSEAREGFYASKIFDGDVKKSTRWEGSISNDDFIYVDLKNTTPSMDKETYDKYITAYSLIKKAETLTPDIVGIAKKYKGFIKDLDNWVDLETFIKDKLTTMSFRKSPEDSLVPFNSTSWDKSNTCAYPMELVNYYKEVENRKSYTNSKLFVPEYHVKLMEDLGALFSDYSPLCTLDIEEIKRVFKESFTTLTDHSWNVPNPVLTARLANLEKFYELHSVKQ